MAFFDNLKLMITESNNMKKRKFILKTPDLKF